jgi:hypothetical protein
LSALIPEEYGGSGLGVAEASVILEEINHSGGNSGVCHAQMYTMGTLLRHGSPAQKLQYLPKIATGELRMQSFGVTEPTTGTDTTKLKTTAVRKGDRYIVNGQKVWISRVLFSDLMLLLARTTPLDQVKRKSDGLSVFLVDLRDSVGKGLTVNPIRNMVNHQTNELFFDNLEVPAENLIGEEGKGFRYILDGMNAERILIAAECIGDGRWFVEKPARTRGSASSSIGRSGRTRASSSRSPSPTSICVPPISCASRRRTCSTPASRAARRRTWRSISAPKPRGKPPTRACRRSVVSASPPSTMSSANSAKLGSIRWHPFPPTSFSPTSASMCSACRVRSEDALS